LQYSNIAASWAGCRGCKQTPADTVRWRAPACRRLTDATNLIERGLCDVVIVGGVVNVVERADALSPPLPNVGVGQSARSFGARSGARAPEPQKCRPAARCAEHHPETSTG